MHIRVQKFFLAAERFYSVACTWREMRTRSLTGNPQQKVNKTETQFLWSSCRYTASLLQTRKTCTISTSVIHQATTAKPLKTYDVTHVQVITLITEQYPTKTVAFLAGWWHSVSLTVTLHSSFYRTCNKRAKFPTPPDCSWGSFNVLSSSPLSPSQPGLSSLGIAEHPSSRAACVASSG